MTTGDARWLVLTAAVLATLAGWLGFAALESPPTPELAPMPTVAPARPSPVAITRSSR